MSTVCCSADQLQFFSGKKAMPSVVGFHDVLELSSTGNTSAHALRRLPLQRGDSFPSDGSFSPSDAYELRRFLPSNCDDEEDEGPDDYARDEFRMYEFKVRRCNRGRSHDWTDCPFAHPGEKARRRDPRRYNYSGTVCPDFRKGGCRKGDACEYAHGVFECWLHPERYRTKPCKDGRGCRRKVCFFAHTPQQLRILSPSRQGSNALSPILSPRCCALCSSQPSVRHQLLTHGGSSPDSPMMVGVSPFSTPASPPLSSPVCPVSPLYSVYQNVLSELSCSLDAMDLNSLSKIGSAQSIPGPVEWSSVPISLEERNQSAYPTGTLPSIWKFRDEEEQLEKLHIHNTFSAASDTSVAANNTSVAADDPDFDWVNELVM